MNNINSPNGQGGFLSGSFRVCDCAVPEPRMKCSENGNTSYCGICSKSLIQSFKKIDYGDFENDGTGYKTKLMLMLKDKTVSDVDIKEFTKTIVASRIHFLDTPAGRKWENIVAWRIAQKENKKK